MRPLSSDDNESTPYAENALPHFDRGWAVFPAAPRAKEPLVKGRSGGYKSQPAERREIERELRRYSRANVGIRLPEDVVALDVDLKADKETGEIKVDGAPTFAELELPPTIGIGHMSNGQPDHAGPYRHHLYRVPDGVTPEEVAALGAARDGIDLIRWTHRLTLGRGSLHKSGETYRWVTKTGKFSGGIPTPEHATRLTPDEWERVKAFFGASSGSGWYESADVDLEEWLSTHEGRPSGALRGAFRKLWTDRTTGRHDAALRAAQRVAHLAEEGEIGAARVLARLQREFVEAVADRSSEDEATEEFGRILLSAVGKATAKTESGDREHDPFLIPEVTTIEIPRGVTRWYDGEQTHTLPGEEPDVPADTSTIEVELSEEFSDTLVAMKIHTDWAQKGRHVVYSPGLGWLRWDKRRWRPVADDLIADAVQKYIKDWFLREVEEGCSSERRGRLSALMSKPRQERLVRALRVVEVIEPERFDRHLDLLNTPSGVVDLKTGVLLPHDPALLMTKITRVGYRKSATHSDWSKAKEALDPARLEWLLGRFGQAITGYTPTDDKVVFLTGPGGNGKSTVTGPLLKTLGSYAALVPATLLLGASDRHPAELMTLMGVRLALAEETPEEGRINVQRLKQVAGVAEMTARKMRQDFITFDQTHSLFVTTNYPPNVVETDHGTWRRLERCVFNRKFRTKDASSGIDRTLAQRVIEDPEIWEAVLADLVRYAVRFFEAKRIMPEPPKEIERDTAAWRADMDPLVEFAGLNLEPDPQAFVSHEELTQGLNEFLRSRSMTEWNTKTVAMRFEQHEGLGFRPRKDKRRLNEKGFSPRFVVSNGAKSGPVVVWNGARWIK